MTDKQPQWRILIVDDEPNNLQLLRQILKGKYQLSMATNGAQAIEIAQKVKPDLILLDIMMPELDGYQTCQKLKSSPTTHEIPVIFITAKTDVVDEKKGFDVGAVDYITKPVSGPIVQARVETHLSLYDQQRAMQIQVNLRTKELAESQKAAIHMLGEAGHYNDTDTGLHIWRMAAYAGLLAQKAGWKVSKAKQLEYAAPMHDTGKIGIPDAILKKPGKLNSEEWQIMKTHAQIGYDILSKSRTPLFQMAAEVALCHHEKWDGTGYPAGLSETDIPESARIVAIADVFDALTMKRPYKEAWPIAKAFEELKLGRGKHFDPNLVECFFDHQLEFLRVKEQWDVREQNGEKAF
ncbi:response regulator [Planctobacterium marinum]|uniref:Two-component system response regulator n=1 Tax=Planctobacterium marinum TaxID=1631968 RepID=A0AA48HKX5_9ALTE|nr:two-component system response regulator [Planctobacterium marinum]